ncbi:MAG: hypothetical protein IJZ76_00790 [Lachnospiraceae bacterium]|nr:hypothetical protein [Lachnospiraceae bacterium]
MTQFSSDKTLITKENAYPILKAFAKEYKKQNGTSAPVELVIVGGGSILLNYGFREATQYFDIMVQSMGLIKNVSYRIADLYNLPDNWLNSDFMRTASYSDKLREVSKHFCSFNNGSLEFRTVNGEYLIAMKMVSAREYRNDISDVIGIIIYMKNELENFSMDRINHAIEFLYGRRENVIKEDVYDKVKEYSKWSVAELEKEYEVLTQVEKQTKQDLININEKYQGVVEEESIDTVIEGLRRRKGR